jgi:hypothetical protein
VPTMSNLWSSRERVANRAICCGRLVLAGRERDARVDERSGYSYVFRYFFLAALLVCVEIEGCDGVNGIPRLCRLRLAALLQQRFRMTREKQAKLYL